MKHLSLALLLTLIPFGSAQAQATRTWISGVGDDGNPCSRTAPGKTFAGALSKTASNGEINVLDPGSYGAVAINKAITLDGGGSLASIQVSAGNGITISAPSGATVILRNLDLTGSGSAATGILFSGGGLLVVEHCRIQGFTQSGLEVALSGTGQLVMRDVAVVGGNIGINLNAAGSLTASLEDVTVQGAGTGLFALVGTVTARQSRFSQNLGHGIVASNAVLTLAACTLTGNGLAALQAVSGSNIRITGCAIYDNHFGLAAAGGSVFTDGSNRSTGNTLGSATPTGTIILQ